MDKILIPNEADIKTARTIVSIWEAHGTRVRSGAPGLDDLLNALVEMVSRGQAVALEALPERLTLRQFAAMINTSESYALWLVRAGHVPCEESASFGPTVAIRDALTFRDERDAKRRAALDEMAAEAWFAAQEAEAWVEETDAAALAEEIARDSGEAAG